MNSRAWVDQFSNMMGYLGDFSWIYVGSLQSDTGIIEGSKFNHISILKGSREHLDSSQYDEIWVLLYSQIKTSGLIG